MTRAFKGFGPEPNKVTTRSDLTKHLVQNKIRKCDDLTKWAEADSRDRGLPVWSMPNQDQLQCWWWSIGPPKLVGSYIEAVSIRMGFEVHFDADGVIDGFHGLNWAREVLPIGQWPGNWDSARKAVSAAHPDDAWGERFERFGGETFRFPAQPAGAREASS